jgi:hypothetical protein
MSARQNSESQTQAAQIARVAMAEREGTALALTNLLAQAETRQEKPECMQRSAFEQLEEVYRWALMIGEFFGFAPARLGCDQDTAYAVADVAEEAWKDLEAKRTLEDDLRLEEEAQEMLWVEPDYDDEYGAIP